MLHYRKLYSIIIDITSNRLQVASEQLATFIGNLLI